MLHITLYMNLLSELVNGTLPSHHLLVTIDVSLYGVILTLHQLAFRGTHARRALFHQRHTNAHVLILKRGAKLVLVVREPQWRSSMEFEVVGCSVVRIGERR